jgi:hypothetical protein
MTRQECEKKILGKLMEIGEIYLQYNPSGKYLGMNYCNGQLSASNSYQKGEKDEKIPIDVILFNDGTIKTCGEYIWPEVDNDAE